jgi:hypothetical protein
MVLNLTTPRIERACVHSVWSCVSDCRTGNALQNRERFAYVVDHSELPLTACDERGVNVY